MRMGARVLLNTIVFTVSLCLVSGCVRLERSYPDKRCFLIHLSRPEKASRALTDEALRVFTFSVSPPYEGKGFVYARGDNRVETDFYNGFVISPGTMVTEEVRRWMAGSGLFGHVGDISAYGNPGYLLGGRVAALYGDYGDPSAPKAVLKMEFLLARDVSAGKEIVFENHYQRTISLDRGSAKALVNGWREALEGILQDFEGDLRDCLQGP